MCPKCGQAVAEHILEQHLMEKCQERIVNCSFCTENLKFCLLEVSVVPRDHHLQCKNCEVTAALYYFCHKGGALSISIPMFGHTNSKEL